MLPLPEGDLGSLAAGMLMLGAGDTTTRGNVEFSCPAGGDPCGIEVMNSLGSLTATSTGGMATAMMVEMPVDPEPTVHMLPLPEGDPGSLAAGMLTLGAGDTATRGNVEFSCPAGGEACAIEVMASLGSLTATSTGGMATAMIVEMPAGPVVHTVTMPRIAATQVAAMLGSGDSATLHLAAGMSDIQGPVTFMCAAGGEDCTITVENKLGSLSATSSGGMASASAMLALEGGPMLDGTMTMVSLMPGEEKTVMSADPHRASQMFKCPATGPACEIHLMTDGGMTMASYTGGMPSAMAEGPMYYGLSYGSGGAGVKAASLLDPDNSDRLTGNIVGVGTDMVAPSMTVTVGGKMAMVMLGDGDASMLLDRMGSATGQGDDGSTLAVDLYTDLADPMSKKIGDVVDLGENVKLDRLLVNESDPRLIPASLITVSEWGEGDNDKVKRAQGTWYGIPGSFSCNGECASAITRLAGTDNVLLTGKIQLGLGPKYQDTMVDVVSDDWLSMGTWLETDADGNMTAGAFYASGMPMMDPPIKGTATTATYAGDAVGRYWGDDDGVRKAGKFTADAALSATFAATPAEQMVSGTLTGFVLDGSTNADWRVALNNGGASVSGMAMGHALTDGEWTHTFYHGTSTTTPNLLANDPTATICTDCPAAVAGDFGARHGNKMVDLIGAFAARR